MSTETRIDTNNEFNWSSITATRDETGAITEINTIFDSGLVREEEFENGVRSRTFTDDAGDAVSYQYRDESYDAEGVLAQRFTVGDDGVLTSEIFDNEQRV